MPLLLLGLLLAASACSENDGEPDEFPNWQQTNDAYFASLYNRALEMKLSSDYSTASSWKVLRKWSLVDSLAKKPTDYVVVHVLQSGTSDETPCYTDSVRVSYEGRLLPSTNFPDGYVFDRSYYGDFDLGTAKPSTFAVGGVIEGWTTVLQQMHPGDYWEVTIPYNLGYGTTASGSIPAYSTLIFKIYLHEVVRK